MMGKKYTHKEILFLEKFYPEYGSKYCSEKLHRDRDAVVAECNRLKIRCKYIYHKINSDRNVNPELFYNISKPTVSYFLGLLWGDGYISSVEKTYQIRIDSIAKDGKEYYKILSKFGKWKKYYCKRKSKIRNNQPQLAIVIGNKPLHKFLSDNDYLTKSLVSPTKILSKIPKKLHSYFWRGFLDADGCIYTNNEPYKKKSYMSFTGSYNQKWNDLINELNALDIHYRHSQTKNNDASKCSRIYISKKEDVRKMGNYIYKGYYKDRIGLSRKFKKFQKFLQYNS